LKLFLPPLAAEPTVPDRFKVCMLAACPFPANHGTPGSIREMAETLVERGHEVHIVTYHVGEDISVRGPRLPRITPLTSESHVIVGPRVPRPLYDLQMVFKTLEVIRRHRPDVLHAHGYEAALAAWLCRLATGLPVVYSGHNIMSDELASYRLIRPRWLADVLARTLDAVVPRLAAATLAAAALAGVLWGALGSSWPVLLLPLALGGILYAGLCVLFGALRWQEVRRFAEAFTGALIPVQKSAPVR
jgi:glycosyltransferase involved in cell wall biosynthesis